MWFLSPPMYASANEKEMGRGSFRGGEQNAILYPMKKGIGNTCCQSLYWKNMKNEAFFCPGQRGFHFFVWLEIKA